MKLRLLLIPFAASFFCTASAQTTPIPITGLCNTGLTTASSQPVGCAQQYVGNSDKPLIPEDPAWMVTGNWPRLIPPLQTTKNSTILVRYRLLDRHGWMQRRPGWLNTNDGVSQWVTPLDVVSPGGWYVYRTAFQIPAGTGTYLLTVEGRVLADDDAQAVFMENPAGSALGCRVVALPPPLTWTTWSPFGFVTPVTPGTYAYLYFVVYEGGGVPNPTGLRVEFMTASVTPE
jgi:hypothetical protein